MTSEIASRRRKAPPCELLGHALFLYLPRVQVRQKEHGFCRFQACYPRALEAMGTALAVFFFDAHQSMVTPDSVNWGSVTGRKKEEKNMQLIARLSFQSLSCANCNSL